MNTHISIKQPQLLPTCGLAYFISILIHYPTFFSTVFLEANSRHHTFSSLNTSECISKRLFRHVLDILISDQQFLVVLKKERGVLMIESIQS